jgi:predicted anti-sigma-YlaC factor YlaD
VTYFARVFRSSFVSLAAGFIKKQAFFGHVSGRRGLTHWLVFMKPVFTGVEGWTSVAFAEKLTESG